MPAFRVNTFPTSEGFQPRAHWAPTTPFRRILFYLRLSADLQTNTIYFDLRQRLKAATGRILDVGCGNSPFRNLLNSGTTEYQGIDVPEATEFGYRNPETIYYDGKVIPFPDETFDLVLCTEVLEHVANPEGMIGEIYRVLKNGGTGIVTIPWSARFHYQPYDYHRYTPSMLAMLFSRFGTCRISPRGTDLSSIGSKVVVGYIRNFLRIKPSNFMGCILSPLRVLTAVVAAPVLLLALVLGHCGIWFGLGSTDDPLGYTVVVGK